MPQNLSDIDLIINQSAEPQINENKSILKTKLNDHTILFTLFGQDIDTYIGLATWRAIEQNTTADMFTEQVFKDLFKPETKPKFKIILYAKDELDIQKIKTDYPDKIDSEVLKRIIETKDKHYFKAEIDGIITVSLTQPEIKNAVIFDYRNIFFEVKLFTCPVEDPEKSVIKHLRNQKLEEYFELRDDLGLLTFSYLHQENELHPAALNTEIFQGRKLPNLWGIHLILIDKEILKDGLDAPARIKTIFETIKSHQHTMKKINELPDNYKYSMIYNIITVMNMSYLISELENQVKKERQEKEKERQEKEKERQEKEKERQEKEKLKKELEKYKQKFGDLMD